MSIEKFVSPFIPQQFPSFYKDEGPNFVAFVKAYYEWMELDGRTLDHSRSLLDYSNVDETESQFLKYFRSTYLSSIPDSVLVDKRLLVKHILDLYRAKGTPRAYELLFRIMFDEDIELYIPRDYVLRPSDGKWEIPRYIEISENPYIDRLIGKQIYNSSRNATAVVESINQKSVENRTIHIIYLSSIDGMFSFGEKILCSSVPEITISNAPTILGSLTAVSVENGGYGFNVGDVLNILGSGFGGKARIASTRDENGKVMFKLVDGGSGFSLEDTAITVATTVNFQITDRVGEFTEFDKIDSQTAGSTANGTLTFSNNSFVELINFSHGLGGSNDFIVGDSITNSNGATATITNIIGGGGSGASFSIGGLVDEEILILNTDFIENYQNAILNATAWPFPKNESANISSVLEDTLSFKTIEAGTISFLTNINPGSGYSSPPYINIVEPWVYPQRIDDGKGGYKGYNAEVSSNVANAHGIAVSAEVVDSGFGYVPGETVTLSKFGNEGVVVTAAGVVKTHGKGSGRWKDYRGFVSDINKIHDSYYYQDFSYEIVAQRMSSVYEKLVKDLIHPSGTKMFGRFRLKSEIVSDQSTAVSFEDMKKKVISLNLSNNNHSSITIPGGYVPGKIEVFKVHNVSANTVGVSNVNKAVRLVVGKGYVKQGTVIHYRANTNSLPAIPFLTPNAYYYAATTNSIMTSLSTNVNGPIVQIQETRTTSGIFHQFVYKLTEGYDFSANNGTTLTAALNGNINGNTYEIHLLDVV